MGYYTRLLSGHFVYKHTAPMMYENNLLVMTEAEKRAAEAYVSKQKGHLSMQVTEYNNEMLFRLPSAETAARHARAGGRSYVYYWTMPCADPEIGACHAIELSYVFNNPQVDIYTEGLYNKELGDAVQRMWVNFARCGDPGTESHPWEPYEPETRRTMILGEEIRMESDPGKEDREQLGPLLYHYFNGCYSQLRLDIPQTGRILCHLAAAIGLVLVLITLVSLLIVNL